MPPLQSGRLRNPEAASRLTSKLSLTVPRPCPIPREASEFEVNISVDTRLYGCGRLWMLRCVSDVRQPV